MTLIVGILILVVADGCGPLGRGHGPTLILMIVGRRGPLRRRGYRASPAGGRATTRLRVPEEKVAVLARRLCALVKLPTCEGLRYFALDSTLENTGEDADDFSNKKCTRIVDSLELAFEA